MQTLSVVGFEECTVQSLCCASAVSLIKEAELLRQSNVSDGILSEEVGPAAIIEGEFVLWDLGKAFLHGRGAGCITRFHESPGLVFDFELPCLDVFESICGRKDLALARVLRPVNHVGQVVVWVSRQDLIEVIFGAFAREAINILPQKRKHMASQPTTQAISLTLIAAGSEKLNAFGPIRNTGPSFECAS